MRKAKEMMPELINNIPKEYKDNLKNVTLPGPLEGIKTRVMDNVNMANKLSDKLSDGL